MATDRRSRQPRSSSISEVTLRPDHVRKFIGFDISNEEMQSVLESLELSVSIHDDPDNSERWEVSIPTFRGDLQREVDLIEEIVRVYGTDKIPESDVVARGISEKDHRIYTVNDSVASYLAGQNFNEAYLYSLRDPEETKFFFGEESHKVLALDNPLQSDQSHLRPSLIPGLLDVLKLNAARGTGATRFFERGHVYREVKWQDGRARLDRLRDRCRSNQPRMASARGRRLLHRTHALRKCPRACWAACRQA